MPLDIRPDHLEIVQDILQRYAPDCRVRAFGSRVNGAATATSDLDLCFDGDAPLSVRTLLDLREAFSFSDIPYCVDIVDGATMSAAFRRLIEQKSIDL